MQAVWYEHFGPAGECLQLGEWDTPSPGHGEVLVRLHTSGVNPSDVKKRAGITLPNLLDAGPVIPHSDGAGVIEAVGPGVSAARIGERVWVYNAQHRRRCGTAAQYVALPAGFAVPLPETVDFATGAGLGASIPPAAEITPARYTTVIREEMETSREAVRIGNIKLD